jgi:hypothetical protein
MGTHAKHRLAIFRYESGWYAEEWETALDGGIARKVGDIWAEPRPKNHSALDVARMLSADRFVPIRESMDEEAPHTWRYVAVANPNLDYKDVPLSSSGDLPIWIEEIENDRGTVKYSMLIGLAYRRLRDRYAGYSEIDPQSYPLEPGPRF